MADLGPLLTRQSLWNEHNVTPRATTRNAMAASIPAYYTPGWAGHTGHPHSYGFFYRTRSSTPAWWGSVPAGSNPVLPNYELRGRVLQRDPETLEDNPLANVRVALFFRRTNFLVDLQVTDEDGYFVFPNIMPGNQAYYAIALDPEGDPLQNSLIYDRLTSQEP